LRQRITELAKHHLVHRLNLKRRRLRETLAQGIKPPVNDRRPLDLVLKGHEFSLGVLHMTVNVASGEPPALEIRGGPDRADNVIGLNVPAVLKPRQPQQSLFKPREIGQHSSLDSV
jgi:hypothetical protein